MTWSVPDEEDDFDQTVGKWERLPLARARCDSGGKCFGSRCLRGIGARHRFAARSSTGSPTSSTDSWSSTGLGLASGAARPSARSTGFGTSMGSEAVTRSCKDYGREHRRRQGILAISPCAASPDSTPLLRLDPGEPPWHGPVCPVVWEGRHREVSPCPDLADRSLQDQWRQPPRLARGAPRSDRRWPPEQPPRLRGARGEQSGRRTRGAGPGDAGAGCRSNPLVG